MPLIKGVAQLYDHTPVCDIDHPADAQNQLTMGDLHGNALKLIYFLIRQGVLVLRDKDDYQRLINIYQNNLLTKDDLLAFDRILRKAKLNPVGTVRLIGDEFADRGRNDYFTLKVIDLLRRNGISVEILLSNHGMEFIEAYECREEFTTRRLDYPFSQSMAGLAQLIARKIVTKEEVQWMIDNSYKPFLRALSYTLSNDNKNITIYSHAGIGLNTIAALAEQLGVNYRDDRIEDLAETMDNINAAFYKCVKRNEVHTLYTDKGMRDNSLKDPFVFLMWNRSYNAIDRPNEKNGYTVDYVHGHDSGENSQGHIYNLNNLFGKANFRFRDGEEYLIHFSQDRPAPELEKIIISGAFAKLIKKIDAMKAYGERLKLKDVYSSNVASLLSDRLMSLTRAYLQVLQPSPEQRKAFIDEFIEKLHSEDAVMNKHRALWRPIVLNIGIALTGLGLFVLVGKLVQSKLSTGKFALFYTTTKRQRHVQKIEKIANHLHLAQ